MNYLLLLEILTLWLDAALSPIEEKTTNHRERFPRAASNKVWHFDPTIGEQQTATPVGTQASNFSYCNSNSTSSVQGLRPGLISTALNLDKKISFMVFVSKYNPKQIPD